MALEESKKDTTKRNHNEKLRKSKIGLPFLWKGVIMANYNGQFQDASSNVLLATPHSYANIEGSTASQAYTKGQMLVYNNRLCEVTAAIASGNTLTIGTNIAYKNVGDIGKQLVATDGTGFYFDVKDGKYGYYPNASRTASQFVPFGGSFTETSLWTNPAASSGFGAQVVDFTNSQSMANYDYLKFKWRYSNTNAGTGNFAVIVKVTDFRTFTTDNQRPRLVLGGWNGTNSFNSGRAVRYNSDTSVYFYTGVKMGTTDTNSGWIIPTEIIGLK